MEIKVKILNEEGMHARPAGVLVKLLSGFRSKVELVYNGKTANARSLLSIMSLGLTKDAEVSVKADGEDAPQALEAIKGLVERKFQS